MKLRIPFWPRPHTAKRLTFLRAVHYFARAHPSNFWDGADLSEAPADLARIRSDGFDAVIYVVPWRGFQRSVTPSLFDEVNLERLRRCLAMAEEAGLKSILRVSFPWNFDPDSVGSADDRVMGLFTSEEVRRGWLAYLERLRDIAHRFPGFQFAFFSWEDVQHTRELMVHREVEDRRRFAGAMGYRDFLAQRYDLDRLSRMFGTPIGSYDDVYVPLADCEAYASYVEFINEALFSLLARGREVWPALALQVRVDFDAVRVNGEHRWIENDMRVDDRSLRVSYWSPCMFARNEGETITAAEALASLERVLRRVSGDGRNSNHFLDQFLFYDESPHFGFWPKIVESEITAFLKGAARLLRRYSRGYGLWNYFDYRVNHFYNPIFVRGLHGWVVEGSVRIEGGADSSFVSLEPGAAIWQEIDCGAQGYVALMYQKVAFTAHAKAEGEGGRVALVTDGNVEGEAEVPVGGPSDLRIELPPERHRAGVVRVAIRNTGTRPVSITRLCLWGAVFRSRVYDENGAPDRFLDAVREMNRVA